jgi:hypothetical protein
MQRVRCFRVLVNHDLPQIRRARAMNESQAAVVVGLSPRVWLMVVVGVVVVVVGWKLRKLVWSLFT